MRCGIRLQGGRMQLNSYVSFLPIGFHRLDRTEELAVWMVVAN
jgi:hypothetical protein